MASELCLAPARPKQDWIRRAVREGSQTQVAETLHEQQVDGEAVLDLTYERLVAEPYKIR